MSWPGSAGKQDADRLAGENTEPVIVDITDEEQVAALADRVAHDPQARPLRVVVNNAGVAINAPVEAISPCPGTTMLTAGPDDSFMPGRRIPLDRDIKPACTWVRHLG